MKVLRTLLLSLFLLFACYPVYALITTDNVDKDTFNYEVGYRFATDDLAAAQTNLTIPLTPKTVRDGVGASNVDFTEYTISRNGRLVGIAITGKGTCSSGAATFDVTLNGTVTGVQCVIESEPTRSPAGTSGSSGSQYAYIRQDRSETASARGFQNDSDEFTTRRHNADNPYGRATPISAGDRVGVVATTSSGFAGAGADYVIVVYVLE